MMWAKRRRTGEDESGFTLVEAVVAAGLLAVGIGVALSIVVGLNEQSEAELARVSRTQAVTSLITQLESDVANARPCAATRVAPIVRAVDSNSVTFAIDTAGDGSLEEVTWAANDGQITRSSRVLAPDCSTAIGAVSSSVLVTGVEPVAGEIGDYASGFWVSADNRGAAGAIPDAAVDCTVIAEFDDCRNYTRLHLDANLIGGATGAVSVSRTWIFDPARTRLQPDAP